jgi:carboxymethylenebutenolidase
MCDSDNNQGYIVDTSFTRRSVVLTMSSAAAVAGLPSAALAANVVEKDVMVPTPDGSADAALFYPAGKGTWPAVLMWPDILEPRPVFTDYAARMTDRDAYRRAQEIDGKLIAEAQAQQPQPA